MGRVLFLSSLLSPTAPEAHPQRGSAPWLCCPNTDPPSSAFVPPPPLSKTEKTSPASFREGKLFAGTETLTFRLRPGTLPFSEAPMRSVGVFQLPPPIHSLLVLSSLGAAIFGPARQSRQKAEAP